MKSRLIRSIDDHLPLEFIQEIKIDGNAAEAFSLAAYRGRLDVVSWLLSEGVSIPYGLLDEKLADHQPFIHRFLSACSPNSAVFEPALIEGICFRALRQKQCALAERVLDKLSDPKSFVAMAFEKYQLSVASQLMTRSQALKQENKMDDLSIYTPGYWAALHDISGINNFHNICQTLQDWVYTLSQLSAEGHENAFDHVYKRGMEQDKQLDAEFFDKHWLPEDKLAQEVSDIYKKASAGHCDVLKQANLTLEQYYTVFLHAYNQKNYVAVNSILNCCDPQALLRLLFSRNEKNASMFLLVGGDFDFFALLVTWQKESFLKNYIQLVWGTEDNLQRLIEATELADCKEYAEFVIQKKKNYLNYDIQLLSRFATQFDKEIEAKNCCAGRFNCNRSRKCFFGISSTLILACIALMTTGSIQGISKDTTSGVASADGPGGFIFIQGAAFGSMIFTGLLTYVFCMQFGRRQVDSCGLDSRLINCGTERFNDVAINQYGGELRASAEMLFAEYAQLKSNPLANKTLANIISEILPDIQRLAEERKARLAAMPALVEAKIDIPLVKASETKQTADDEPELLIRQVGLFSSRAHLKTPLLAEYKTGFTL